MIIAWVVAFLKELERLVAPPPGSHHFLHFEEELDVVDGWTGKLILNVFHGPGRHRRFVLENGDTRCLGAEDSAQRIAKLVLAPPEAK